MSKSIPFLLPFLIVLFFTISFGYGSAQEEPGVLLRGRIVSILPEQRSFVIRSHRGTQEHTIFVDDPNKLKNLKIGMRVQITAEKSELKESAYMAREISAAGMRCMCDPTGVRTRMRRAWKRGGNCGRGCCDR